MVMELKDQVIYFRESYQDSLDIKSKFTLTGTVVGIAGKYSNCWTVSWARNIAVSKLTKKSFCMEVMKYDSKMAGCLFHVYKN